MWALTAGTDPTTGGGLDLGTALLAYGVAAPFAALCFWLLQQSRAEVKELRSELGREKDERLRDAQRAVAGSATRLYDATQFTERATRLLADVATPDTLRDELEAVRADLRAVVERAGISLEGDRSLAREAGRSAREGPGNGGDDRSWEREP